MSYRTPYAMHMQRSSDGCLRNWTSCDPRKILRCLMMIIFIYFQMSLTYSAYDIHKRLVFLRNEKHIQAALQDSHTKCVGLFECLLLTGGHPRRRERRGGLVWWQNLTGPMRTTMCKNHQRTRWEMGEEQNTIVNIKSHLTRVAGDQSDDFESVLPLLKRQGKCHLRWDVVVAWWMVNDGDI